MKLDMKFAGVVSTPDKQKGRGMKLQYTPVKEYAIEKNLKVFQPEKIANNEEFKNEIRSLEPDVVCVVAYGKILPKSFLKIPKYGCINVHGSLLPDYRGAAPIQWAVLNGDKETGITTMYMNEKMDEGDIILQEKTEIGEDETTGELWDRLSEIGAKLLIKTLEKIEDGTVTRVPQPQEFTLAPMLSKEMAKINWQEKTSQEIKNLVRGLNPIMGAYTMLADKKVKFWKVQTVLEDKMVEKLLENEKSENNIEDSILNPDILKNRIRGLENGTVIYSSARDGLYIKAKEGFISVLEIQGENAKRMNIKDFLRGNNIQAGSLFE
jgi:methionyl-tRNA formyltransferase